MLYRTIQRLSEIEIPVITFRLPSKIMDENSVLQAAVVAVSQGLTMFEIPSDFVLSTSAVANVKELIKALFEQAGGRDKLLISTSLEIDSVASGDVTALESQFSSLLALSGSNYLDFVRVVIPSGMDADAFSATGAAAFLIRAKKSGSIKAIGFESDMTYSEFEKVASLGAWDFCAFTLNYLDSNNKTADIPATVTVVDKTADTPATVTSSECLRKVSFAESHSLGVFSLHPLGHGKLAMPPRQVLNVFAKADVPRIPAEWALRWVLENQNVTTAVITMDSIDKVFVNCAIGSASLPNSLPSKQLEVIQQAADVFTTLG